MYGNKTMPVPEDIAAEQVKHRQALRNGCVSPDTAEGITADTATGGEAPQTTDFTTTRTRAGAYNPEALWQNIGAGV